MSSVHEQEFVPSKREGDAEASLSSLRNPGVQDTGSEASLREKLELAERRIIEVSRNEINRLTDGAHWNSLVSFLDDLGKAKETFSEKFIDKIFSEGDIEGNIEGNTEKSDVSLHGLVCRSAPPRVLEKVVAIGVDINLPITVHYPAIGIVQGVTALHLAAERKDPHVIGCLLNNGANPNARDGKGDTPLHIYYRGGTPDQTLRVMFEATQADFNATDILGKTALTYCILGERWQEALVLSNQGFSAGKITDKEAKELLSRLNGLLHKIELSNWDKYSGFLLQLKIASPLIGTEPIRTFLNSSFSNGWGMLHLLARGGAPPELLETAISLGADPNSAVTVRNDAGKSIPGWTPLHFAARNSHSSIVKLLLEKGAPVDARDSDGFTPLLCVMEQYIKGKVATKEIPFDTIKFLIQKGTDTEIPFPDGERIVSKLVAQGDFVFMGKLVEVGLPERSLKELDTLKLKQGYTRELEKAWKEKDPESLKRLENLIQLLKILKATLGPEVIRELVSFPASKTLPGLLPLLVSRLDSPQLLNDAISLGGDDHLKVRVDVSDGPTGLTLLHLSSLQQKLETSKVLLSKGAQLDARDDAGNTPLLLSLTPSENNPINLSMVKFLLESGANSDVVNKKGAGAYLKAITTRSYLFIALVSEYLAKAKINSKVEAKSVAPSAVSQLAEREAAFLTLLGNRIISLDKGYEKELVDLLLQHNEPYHAYLYLQAAEDSLNKQDRLHRGKAFNELSKAMPLYAPGTIKSLITSIERLFDNEKSVRGYHPNEAELFSLLNHPTDPRRENQWVGQLTKTITSITRFTEHKLGLSGRLVTAWGNIGTLTFSFPRWKFDTMRITEKLPQGDKVTLVPSLFEKYGFEKVPFRPSDSKYGAGFLLPKGSKKIAYWVTEPSGERKQKLFDARTHIEFRRAYILVSHPEHGTLMIRNSSPVFGRDTMTHPSYWSPDRIGAGLTEAQLQNADGALLEGPKSKFRDILQIEINKPEVALDTHLTFLLEQVRAVVEDYAAWKFDTRSETAWDSTEKEPLLLGGQYSPGFSHMVELLSETYKRRKENDGSVLPTELAFFHQQYPPWHPFSYTLLGEKKRHTLPITPKIIKVLNDLVEGITREEDLKATGVRQFFQEGGFDNQGELVMLGGVE